MVIKSSALILRLSAQMEKLELTLYPVTFEKAGSPPTEPHCWDTAYTEIYETGPIQNLGFGSHLHLERSVGGTLSIGLERDLPVGYKSDDFVSRDGIFL